MRNKKYIHNFGRNGKVNVDVQMYVREIRGEDLLCVVRQQVERLPGTSEPAVRFPVLQKNWRPHSWKKLNRLPHVNVVFGHRGKYCGFQQRLYSANYINLHQMGQRLMPAVRRWITATSVHLHRPLHCP